MYMYNVQLRGTKIVGREKQKFNGALHSGDFRKKCSLKGKKLTTTKKKNKFGLTYTYTRKKYKQAMRTVVHTYKCN